MLISFSVENFLSFKEKSTLSMLPDALKEKESNLHIPYLYDMNARLLKSISIYGHNSHGKSNFIKSYLFFRNFILSSAEKNQEEFIDVENFRLNSATANLPSCFEIIFYIRDTKFRYGFKVTPKRVVEEWLYYAQPKVRENYLFHRFEQEIKTSKNWQKETGVVLEKAIMFTKNYQLLLSTLVASNEIPTPVNKIADWFKGNIIVQELSEEKYLKYALMVLSIEKYRPLINKLIDKADLGFTTIIDKIDTLLGKKLDISEDLLRVWFKTELKEFSLYTQHNFYDETHKLIDTIKFEFLKSESSGTLRFLIVACLLCQAIKREQLLIIDEIDSKFHSLLLEVIILFYNDPKINVSGSQMIFTTHNTILLNEVLRRDQIFFIEKNEFGESELRKAHSSKNPIRIDSSIEKDYRKGKLGGVSKKLKKDGNQSSFEF